MNTPRWRGPISHFIQEDSGQVVGRAMADWMKANALKGMTGPEEPR
jgi:hypothetical protein